MGALRSDSLTIGPASFSIGMTSPPGLRPELLEREDALERAKAVARAAREGTG